MNLEQFKAALRLLRMKPTSKATYGALLVLVDGKKVREAKDEAECSRQAIEATMRKITAAAKVCPHCGRALPRGSPRSP